MYGPIKDRKYTLTHSDDTGVMFLKVANKYNYNAINYTDRELLKRNPKLLSTPIYVKFDSSIPVFNYYEFYGYVKNYII